MNLTRRYSVVVLTFNRNHLLDKLLPELQSVADRGVEVIIVDNCSDPPANNVVARFPWARCIRAGRNLGAAGRNLGFEASNGDVVICLDDDISGLDPAALEALDREFDDPSIAVVNFRVLEEGTRRIVNWVHHRDVEKYAMQRFETYEITEGAAAIRRNAFLAVGGYPPSFFISHEGPDVAFRLMGQGFRVIYTPEIEVIHSFAPQGRASWRNYYFDTRNVIWLAIRNLPPLYALRLVSVQLAAMLVYSVRDGYFRWWAKGVWDATRGLRTAWSQRLVLSREAMRRVHEIDRHRPSFVLQAWRRVVGRERLWG